jgi:pyruvate dehydrogenase E1 component alpha subunit
VTDISVRAVAYGIVGESIDGNDLLSVIDSAGRAIERARSGAGATLINMATYRHSGHFVGDAEQYRAREEVQTNKDAHDPIGRFVQRMVDDKTLTPADVDALNADVDAVIVAANEFAIAAPFPDPAGALRDVWTTGSQQ